jgi:hypothetical protein
LWKRGFDVKSIFVWWDRNFDEQFQELLLSAFFETIKLGEDFSDRFDVRILGNFVSSAEKYGNADSFFDTNYDPKRDRVNAHVLLFSVGTRWPQQNSHMHVIGASHDLWKGTPTNNFVYGLTMKGFATIVSCSRMPRYGDMATSVFQITALHENAHLFGAPNEARGRDLEEQADLGKHCRLEDCALGQIDVDGRPGALEATRSVFERHQRTGNWFCDECTADIVAGKWSLVKRESERKKKG